MRRMTKAKKMIMIRKVMMSLMSEKEEFSFVFLLT